MLPSPLLVTARLNEEEPLAWPVSTLRSSRQPTVTASSGLLSQKKTLFLSLLQISVNCYGLRPSSADFSFVSSKALSSFYQLSHFASTEHALAKDGAHFCLRISFCFSTARFANISLQASPTFRRSQRGHNMEVWASIDVVLLLGRAQMSTKKIYIKKLFL